MMVHFKGGESSSPKLWGGLVIKEVESDRFRFFFFFWGGGAGFFEIAVKGGRQSEVEGNQKFYWGDFFTEWRKPEEEWFWQFKPFSKLKTAFSECWTSIKIKINMTCVSKEYEIKTKMEQEQWLQLKMLFLELGNCCLVRGDWLLWEG